MAGNQLTIIASVVLAAVVVAALLVARWLRRNKRGGERRVADLVIDVSRLDDQGPASDGPHLEFYGTPVRLAVLVVAPAGRQGELPPPEVLPAILEHLVPGLANVIANHQPLIRRWPQQLSAQGFTQAFFNNVALPGNRGKGTPWCSIAGRLQVGDRGFLIGMACVASAPNGLGHYVVQHEGQWPDILRIRDAPA